MRNILSLLKLIDYIVFLHSSSNSLDANFIENEVQYRVIAPVLPSCVDSAMYAHWCKLNP